MSNDIDDVYDAIQQARTVTGRAARIEKSSQRDCDVNTIPDDTKGRIVEAATAFREAEALSKGTNKACAEQLREIKRDMKRLAPRVHQFITGKNKTSAAITDASGGGHKYFLRIRESERSAPLTNDWLRDALRSAVTALQGSVGWDKLGVESMREHITTHLMRQLNTRPKITKTTLKLDRGTSR